MNFLIKIILIATCILVFVACSNKEGKKGKNVTGSIESLTIDFVKEHKSWCRTSFLFYQVSLTNESEDTIKLYQQDAATFCHLDEKFTTHQLCLPNRIYSSDFWKESYKDSTKLVILNISKDTLIAPKQKIEIKYILQLNIYGFSLGQTELFYGELIKSDFSIQSVNLVEGYDTITFQKSDNFEIIKKIDDEVIFKERQKTGEVESMKEAYLDDQAKYITKMIHFADDIGAREKMLKDEEFKYHLDKYTQDIIFFEKKYGNKYKSEERELLERKLNNN